MGDRIRTSWLAVLVALAATPATTAYGQAYAARQTSHQGSLTGSSLAMPSRPVPQTTPAAPFHTPAIDCVESCPPGREPSWKALQSEDNFQRWAQGEYVGRARLPHVPTYRLRVDDKLEFVYRVDRNRLPGHYKLNVGDEVMLDSATSPDLRRTLTVLPDGTIVIPHLGGVEAAGSDVNELRTQIEERLKEFIETPAISITPIKTNSKLEDLRYTVAGMSGFGGQVYLGQVTPEGTIQLPAVGNVPAQGLTLAEFKTELDERYAEQIEGMEVVPILHEKAPSSVYVLGEVLRPGRFWLDAPTTVMQALAMAGSWNVGAEITHIVVFRRGDDWRLMATALDLRPALLGKKPCPAEEIWLADCDLIIVPKSAILRADNFIELVFTRGVYGVVPIRFNVGYEPFKGFIPPFLPFGP